MFIPRRRVMAHTEERRGTLVASGASRLRAASLANTSFERQRSPSTSVRGTIVQPGQHGGSSGHATATSPSAAPRS
jgi:hypothetical protein